MIGERIHVAAGIVYNPDGEILIAKRARRAHQGGLWEFPGGKKKTGESVTDALRRELREELGLIVDSARPFIRIKHDYPDKSVILDAWLITQWHGLVQGKEGQEIFWASRNELTTLPFPDANRSIIKALGLPSLYLISPGPLGSDEAYLRELERCLKAGACLLQLRCRQKLIEQKPALIRQTFELCNQYSAILLLNASPGTALEHETHGVHLSSVRLLQLNNRPLGKDYWVSASCHNKNEITHACRIGVDFIVLSPVEPTPSHPEAKPLGWEKFSRLADNATVPVYALGGMNSSHLQKAWRHGAQGIAMLSGVWASASPAERVRECVSAW
ncbi:MAG TPA: Nudix family hydrolase [Gammaproteobacteria bacterium]|nr:Nudix family hydrolase [Gammaproteobacteria bacterium]